MVNREIEYLEDYEHLLKRPEMYISSVIATEERVPIIEDGRLFNKIKIYSVGMHRLFQEVLDNAFDEAKRCFAEKRPMTKIFVRLKTDINEISIHDYGMGFKNADKINKKTKCTTVETAMTFLRSGSNFNDNAEESYSGKNGVGVSIVNMLSEEFSIFTNNDKIFYSQKWNNFKSYYKDIRKSKKHDHKGTVVSFIPRVDVFKDEKWDIDIIKTRLILKNFNLRYSDLKNIEFDFYIDDKKVNLNESFLPNNTFYFNTKNKDLKVVAYPSFENSTSISFINDSMCYGLHQKIINETISDRIFSYDGAYKYFETYIILNTYPKYVKFGEQNKINFKGVRQDVEQLLKFNLNYKDISACKNSIFYTIVKETIEEATQIQEVKKLKKAKKENKLKISDKFYDSQKRYDCFITEGLSALNSILQARDPYTQSFYALKGKIKNASSLDDLSDNVELVELINILSLNIEDKGNSHLYRRIIIASDFDDDGKHITSLLINFFYKWFPNVIRKGDLYILNTPLVGVIKNKKYFYSLDDFYKSNIKDSVKYFKGLGSLSKEDWNFVFSDLKLTKVKTDKESKKYIEIAFGNNTDLRKSFLMG